MELYTIKKMKRFIFLLLLPSICGAQIPLMRDTSKLLVFDAVKQFPVTGAQLKTFIGAGGGSVATDAIWDAAGDLAVGSGPDAAVRLARGTALQQIRVNAGGTNIEYFTPSAGSGDITNGGNTTGAAITIGTNDAFGLNLETNNVVKLGISSTGVLNKSTFIGAADVINTIESYNMERASADAQNIGFGGAVNWAGKDENNTVRTLASQKVAWQTMDASGGDGDAYMSFEISGNLSLREGGRFSIFSGSVPQLQIGGTSGASYQTNSITPVAAGFLLGGDNPVTVGSGQGSVTISNNSTNNIAIHNTVNAATSTAGIVLGNATSFTQTSGTRNYINYNSSFAPTSGTAIHNQFAFTGTLNQTGGANGIIRGINLAHTMTAVADYRAIEIADNHANAKGIYQTGALTTNNLVGRTTFGATTAPTALIQVAAGSATVAPIKLTSGTLMTTPQAGAIEFLADAYHATITTGAARRTFAFTSDITSVNSDAIWDAKGDFAVGTGANTAIRLAVGTDGQGIYADAATATGVRWGPSIISPAQITADQNDYAPAGWAKASVVRVSGDNSIRGVTSFSATFDGDIKLIINTGTFPIYFPPEHEAGTAANRISGSASFVLYPLATCQLMYDNTTARWRILSGYMSSNIQPNKTIAYKFTAGSGTAADFGDITFGVINAGSGTGTINASATLPAGNVVSTLVNAAGGGYLSFPKTSTSYSAFGAAMLFHDALVSIPTLSDGTQTFQAGTSLTATVASAQFAPANSVAIVYNHNLNGGNWTARNVDNGATPGELDLGVAVVAGTMYHLSIEVSKDNLESRFFIDGVYKGRLTTRMPNAVVMVSRTLIVKSAGIVARTMNVHSMYSSAIYP